MKKALIALIAAAFAVSSSGLQANPTGKPGPGAGKPDTEEARPGKPDGKGHKDKKGKKGKKGGKGSKGGKGGKGGK